MSDLENPYREAWDETPGQKYERVANEVAMFFRLIGMDLTPKGVDALAILIGEFEAYIDQLTKHRRN